MPIWLRRYTYNEILNAKNAESEAVKKSSKGKGKSNIDLNNPIKTNIPKQAYDSKQSQSTPSTPNYITKASKK
tara:strand:- start:853 stop:1071 length:219 start_codon:yes stop_codon:yes gene_type:complete